MSFELTGKIIEKSNTVQVSDKFKKREFVIEKVENNGGMVFTDTIKFQLTQDRCNLIDNVNEGEDVKVQFNIRGNKWEKEGKVSYFTNLDAWRIEKVQSMAAPSTNDTPPPSSDDVPFEPESDDLPF